MKRILVIEDDKSISRLLTLAIKTNNYESILATTGIMGLNLFINEQPDLVLLDLGLPDIDGVEILRQIRNISKTPVIVVSAREALDEKIECLDLGADDYVTKPFNAMELMARIRVCFRKTFDEIKSNIFEYNNLFIDFDKLIVKVFDEEVKLTKTEFKILKLLIDYRGKVLTHTFIQRHIWGYEGMDEYQSLRVYITNLRKKLEKNDIRYIITEIGVGYRFIE